MDRIVVSFPKSGRTWLRVMLDDLAIDAHYTHGGASHQDARLISELDTRIAEKDGRFLFLMRDPRDTAVSGYHQATRRLKTRYPGTISDFIRDPRHGIEKIVAFNRLWTELAASRPDIEVLTYESMQTDTEAAVQKVLTFFGEHRPNDMIRAVIKRNEFNEMQRREVRGEFDPAYRTALGPRADADRTDPNNLKCRKGQVGGFREELSDEDVAYCDATLAKLGYSIAA